MNDPNNDEIDELIKYLSSSFPVRRKEAAQKLGNLTSSSESIIRALAVVVAMDEDPEVRMIAMQALQTPVHQSIIKEKPELLIKPVEQVVRSKEQAEISNKEEVMNKFLRVRSQERLRYFLLFIVFFLFVGFGIFQNGYNTCSLVIGVLLSVLFVFLSWRYYRCPSCDSWLGGWKAGINVWWSSPPLNCPLCGVKLM